MASRRFPKTRHLSFWQLIVGHVKEGPAKFRPSGFGRLLDFST